MHDVRRSARFRSYRTMETILNIIAISLCQNAELAPLKLSALLLKSDAVITCVPTKDAHSVEVTSIVCARSVSIRKGVLKLGDSSFQASPSRSYAFQRVSKPTVFFLKYSATENQWRLTDSARGWFEALGAGVVGTPDYLADNRFGLPKKPAHVRIREILFPTTLKRLQSGVYSKPDVLATISKSFKSLRGPKT